MNINNKFFTKFENYFNLFKLSFNKKNYFFERLNRNNISEFENLNHELKSVYKQFFEEDLFKLNYDNLINNEIKKSYIKTILNYSYFSKIAATKTAFNFAKQKNIDLKKIFYTNCYSILHLPNDRIEEGNYHIDQDGGNTIYTIWTPITDYKYFALNYFRFGYLIFKLFRKITSKNLSIFCKSIKVFKFNSIAWSGLFMHKGNLNQSKNYTSASVIWISIGKNKKSDISYNLYKNIENLDTYKHTKISNKKNIVEDFNKLLNLIDLIILFNNSNDKIEIKKFIKQLDKSDIFSKLIIDKNLEYSFFFSILSQRMQTMLNRNMNIEMLNSNNLIVYFDILSVLIGLQSYSSFMRVINSFFLKPNDIDEIKLSFIKYNVFKDLDSIESFIINGYE